MVEWGVGLNKAHPPNAVDFFNLTQIDGESPYG